MTIFIPQPFSIIVLVDIKLILANLEGFESLKYLRPNDTGDTFPSHPSVKKPFMGLLCEFLFM